MEKYGVACGCKSGNPDPNSLTKLADGSCQCPHCGARYDRLRLKDEVKVEDRGIRQAGEKK